MLQKLERKQGHQRLARLATHLRSLRPGEMYDQRLWACCALGHATSIPEFQDAGLTFDPNHNAPAYGEAIGVNAAMRFFELSFEDACELFGASSRNATEEADYIDQVLDKLALEAMA